MSEIFLINQRVKVITRVKNIKFNDNYVSWIVYS